ncbi:phosphate signaling complex protein PhoU [Acidaminobacter sp. JC074]|uniref:phosphate signaling complex protein PhoU n=1 Tax=Acidaminobacter sp. JC074 TaxID=2530199 RepID=UPI001F0D93EB|nr:phosphate signaling complex protein PhoU [Acidaminobacter sp. JC074]MCH4891278.1 phosphate signaling complex protein PhoU [Acidaminobacter sp. JC074]
MRNVYVQELKDVTSEVIQMAGLVQEMLKDVMHALENKDLDLAKKIIASDDKIDKMELDIEDHCIDLIATQNPIASDLRRITTILRMITDLERIADHCVNIAKVVIANNGRNFVKPLVDLPRMRVICSEMIEEAIRSFTNEDVDLAREVIKRDDEVDMIYERIYLELLAMLSEDSDLKDQVVLLLLIGRYLERIADHTTNISERTIYMMLGLRK